MAGIEKVCEFSGDYEGWNMYAYKRNHIQVHPRYRKRFRGATHTLFLTGKKPYFLSKHGGLMAFHPQDKEHFEPPFETDEEYVQYMREVLGERLVNMVDFNLRIDDPDLAGEVEGNYRETTTDLTSLKRRLKRMLRCKELNIVNLINSPVATDAATLANDFWADKDRSKKEDREACKADVSQYRQSLIDDIQKVVKAGSEDAIKTTILKKDTQWVALVVALRRDHSVFFSESRFRDEVRESLPEQAKRLGWL